jgi:hypothetical protein
MIRARSGRSRKEILRKNLCNLTAKSPGGNRHLAATIGHENVG